MQFFQEDENIPAKNGPESVSDEDEHLSQGEEVQQQEAIDQEEAGEGVRLQQQEAQKREYEYEYRLELPKAHYAKVLRDTLDVDKEMNPQAVQRQFYVKENAFYMHYTSRDAKLLRTIVNSMFTNIVLILETIKELENFEPTIE